MGQFTLDFLPRFRLNVFSTLFRFIIVGDEILQLRNTIQFGAFTLMVALAVWKNEKFHTAAAFVASALLISWVGISMFSL